MNNLPEFEYLTNLINYRLNNPSGREIPAMPEVETWKLPLKNFITKYNFLNDQYFATLILIGLAPHAVPELFDRAIQEKLKASGDFPEIGGVRGKNFRGFLPTGQTAVFLLAGGNWEQRKKVEQLFWPDKEFAKKKILWLEELPQSEPVLSGKIIMALDYIDLFLAGSSAPPHFSTSFPAKKIETKLRLSDIVLSKEIQRHYKNLEDWIQFNQSLMDKWDMEKRVRKGFRVLFYGLAGTGKTLTAGVLGNETKKDVYKIDLSMVVSKYIGETEKNLELLFARAKTKTGYFFLMRLMQYSVNEPVCAMRMINMPTRRSRIYYKGLKIITAGDSGALNMKNNIDDAFIRRFNDIVKFTIPNEDERKEIWEKSFPENADYDDIPNEVKKYKLTGGNIINSVHFAGIQAVKRRNEPDTGKLLFYLEDVTDGIRKEMAKEGKPFE